MNPSSADWINKFLSSFNKSQLIDAYTNENEFYTHLKETGFIFGVSVSAIPTETLSHLKLTKEELSKVNLFHSLLYQSYASKKITTNSEAIKSILAFYRKLERGKTGFFQKITSGQNPTSNLESILSARLQEKNTLLKKNTISLLTYALLYLDVLAYKHWLKYPLTVKEYYQQMEKSILLNCFYTLKSKQKKNKYDKLLIESFETSSEYILNQKSDADFNILDTMDYLGDADFLEKKYIQDLCCLTVWEDLKLDETEYLFLKGLMQKFNLPEKEIQESLEMLQKFSEKHTKKIFLFEYSHPLKQFYKQSASTVKLLIIRNKDRLVSELEESGELMVLLGQSTVRDLNKEEKGKVKEQLLDICKTIPSLTIFLVPGGSVLLPLLVKFIPKLLPSSFQDNRINPPEKL